MAVLELGYAFAVEPLGGRGDAALGNRDAQVARRGVRCASEQLEGKAAWNRKAAPNPASRYFHRVSGHVLADTMMSKRRVRLEIRVAYRKHRISGARGV